MGKTQGSGFAHAEQHRGALATILRQHPDSKIRLRRRHFREPMLRMIGAAIDDDPHRRPLASAACTVEKTLAPGLKLGMRTRWVLDAVISSCLSQRDCGASCEFLPVVAIEFRGEGGDIRRRIEALAQADP